MTDTNDYEKIVRAKLGSREDVRDYDFMQFSVGVIRGLLGMLSDCRAQIAASERRANEMRQAFIDALNNSQAATPADAALADLADALDEISQMRVGTPYQRNMLSGEQRNALTQAAAALRARQPVKDSFNSRQLKDQASAWEAVYEELLKINPRLSELAPSGKACAIAEIKRLAALRARQQVVVPEDKPFAYGVEFDGINRTERMTNLSADVLRTFTGFEPFPLYRRKK